MRQTKSRKCVIFAGTSEGRLLYEFCMENQIDAVFCVATEYGKGALCKLNGAPKLSFGNSGRRSEIRSGVIDRPRGDNIRVGRMNAEEMADFFQKEKPMLIIDATHPYATEVTENIRNAAEVYRREKNIEEKIYYRVLRKLDNVGGMDLCKPTVNKEKTKLCKPIKDRDETEIYDPITDADQTDETKISYHKDMQEAVCYLQSTEGSILATTGSKQVQELCKLKDFEKRVYLRILPNVEMLSKCLTLGFLPGHMICMQGPFSEELNELLMREHDIKYLLTKQSGETGGYPEKVRAARACGAELVVLVPPQETEGVSVEQMCGIIGNEVILRLKNTQPKCN